MPHPPPKRERSTPASTTLPRSMLGVSQSFFALLQKNVLDRRSWATREELRLAIVSWIEGKYHRKRRQRRLGKLTPVEFELPVRLSSSTRDRF